MLFFISFHTHLAQQAILFSFFFFCLHWLHNISVLPFITYRACTLTTLTLDNNTILDCWYLCTHSRYFQWNIHSKTTVACNHVLFDTCKIFFIPLDPIGCGGISLYSPQTWHKWTWPSRAAWDYQILVHAMRPVQLSVGRGEWLVRLSGLKAGIQQHSYKASLRIHPLKLKNNELHRYIY